VIRLVFSISRLPHPGASSSCPPVTTSGHDDCRPEPRAPLEGLPDLACNWESRLKHKGTLAAWPHSTRAARPVVRPDAEVRTGAVLLGERVGANVFLSQVVDAQRRRACRRALTPSPTRTSGDCGRHLARRRRAERSDRRPWPQKRHRGASPSVRNRSARGHAYTPNKGSNPVEPGLGRRMPAATLRPASPGKRGVPAPARVTLSARASNFPLVKTATGQRSSWGVA
jgi:hypothetical protein